MAEVLRTLMGVRCWSARNAMNDGKNDESDSNAESVAVVAARGGCPPYRADHDLTP